MLAIATAQFMVALDTTIVNVALPHIQQSLGFSDSGLEWVVNAYALTFGGVLLIGGRAGDLLGRRRMFAAGLLLFSAASLAGGLATSQAWLLAARAVQGTGAAITAPAALALIATTFPEGPSRNRAMGVYSATSAVGGAIGLLAGGLLTTYASWRWVLYVNVPIGAAVALAAPLVLAEAPRQRGRFDLPGAIAGAGGIAALVYGLSAASASSGGASHWDDGKVIASLTAAVALLAAFALIQARSRQPLVPAPATARPRPEQRLPDHAVLGDRDGGGVLLPDRVPGSRLGLLAAADRARLPADDRSRARGVRRRRPACHAHRRQVAPARRRGGRNGGAVLAVAPERARQLRQHRPRPHPGSRLRTRAAVRPAVVDRAVAGQGRRLRRGLQPAQHRPAGRRLHRPGGPRHRCLGGRGRQCP